MLHLPRNSPHAQRLQLTARAMNSERTEDHRHAQSAAPATKPGHRSKAAPISFTCHGQLTWDHERTMFPLHLPRKVTTKSENAHGTTSVRSRKAPTRAQQILRACTVKMHFKDLERHECIVNGSELAGHGCEHHRLNTRPQRLPKNPQCDHAVWGTNKE